MSKSRKQDVGLPSSFGISVPIDSKPVDLSGYLEEVFETPKPRESLKLPETEKLPIPEKVTRPRIEPPRKQVNMKPETMRKVEELLRIVRNRGPQRTTAMSEVFDALIGVLYDARDHLEFSNVPKRGQWGAATARAYVTALGKTFSKAIGNNIK